MTKAIQVATQSIKSGDEHNSGTVSIFGTPGAGAIKSGYYGCSIALNLAIGDDMALYMSIGGGTIKADHKIGSDRDKWVPHLWEYQNQFFAYWQAGGSLIHYEGAGPEPRDNHIYPREIFSGCASAEKGGADGEGSVTYYLNSGSMIVLGEDIPEDWIKCETIVRPDYLPGGYGYTHTIWLSGAVIYSGMGTSDSVWMPSQQYQLSALPIQFDYYPWGRFNGTGWDSLNRDGANQDATGLHRFQGQWNRVTNSGGGGVQDHGFRFADGWKVSPEYK